MANNNLLFLLLIVAVVAFLYYGVFDQKWSGGCKWCPGGNKNGDCPSCPTNSRDALKVLRQFARGCTHRLRGVVRENMVSAVDVSMFMTDGENKLVIITDLEPEELARIVSTAHQEEMQKIKAVAISSAMIRDRKNYIVMSVGNGELTPISTPTTQFTTAFRDLEAAARERVGPDDNTLVFFIDEDVPCPEETTPLDETGSVKEECCGRRY